jgi:uncharacterized membrane protein YedE/YeeE
MIENMVISPFIWVIIGIIMVWDSVWKLFGMWRAVKNNSVPWFIVIALFNTLGIIPILYLYVFGKKKVSKRVQPRRRKRR